MNIKATNTIENALGTYAIALVLIRRCSPSTALLLVSDNGISWLSSEIIVVSNFNAFVLKQDQSKSTLPYMAAKESCKIHY
ncbi:MAG TPA: hypothetical protein VIP70_12270 [Nitrososphaeraceae archaeon]